MWNVISLIEQHFFRLFEHQIHNIRLFFSGEKPYQCSICLKSFADRSNMTVSTFNESKLNCISFESIDTANLVESIDTVFKKKFFLVLYHFQLHQRLHSGIKPFACTICPKAFTKKHHLKVILLAILWNIFTRIVMMRINS